MTLCVVPKGADVSFSIVSYSARTSISPCAWLLKFLLANFLRDFLCEIGAFLKFCICWTSLVYMAECTNIALSLPATVFETCVMLWWCFYISVCDGPYTPFIEFMSLRLSTAFWRYWMEPTPTWSGIRCLRINCSSLANAKGTGENCMDCCSPLLRTLTLYHYCVWADA